MRVSLSREHVAVIKDRSCARVCCEKSCAGHYPESRRVSAEVTFIADALIDGRRFACVGAVSLD
jgi:hypothetical protein